MLPHIFLALPCYGGVDPRFMGCVLNLVRRLHSMDDPPFKLKIEIGIDDSIVGRARNRMAARFLATDCTHLMFIDTDMVFSPDDVAKLLLSCISEDVPCVAAGIVAMKTPEATWNFTPGDKPMRESGLVSVPYVGTGFMLIDRAVLKDVRELSTDLLYEAEGGDEAGCDFFRAGVNAAGKYLGEDHFFCELVRGFGFPVFVNTEVRIGHVGKIIYPL